MVTKAPLIMRLRKGDDYIKIGKSLGNMANVMPQEVSPNIDLLSEEILRDGDVESRRFGISKTPIYLEVSNSELVDLTLIDLPGIYKIDVQTEQVIVGLENFLKELYAKFCASKTCIIICVMPATEDLGNQLARGWCKEWDPDGRRSIGVLTKVDLVLNPKEIANRLLGIGKNAAQFRLGVVALKNPCLEDYSDTEKSFFDEWKIRLKDEVTFRDVEHMLMLKALISRMVNIQSSSLQENAPYLRSQIETRLKEQTLKLKSLPKAVTTPFECCLESANLINKLKESLENRCTAALGSSEDERINARLCEKFEEFKETIQNQARKVFTVQTFEHAKSVLKEFRGGTLDDLVTVRLFPSLNAEENEKMIPSTEELIKISHNFVLDVCQGAVEEIFSDSFPTLKTEFQIWMEEFLALQYTIALEQLAIKLDSEEYIYTLDREYNEKVQSLIQNGNVVAALLATTSSNDEETGVPDVEVIANALTITKPEDLLYMSPSDIDVLLMHLLVKLHCYRQIIDKNFIDDVCKMVHQLFVKSLIRKDNFFHNDNNRCLNSLTNFLNEKIKCIGENELVNLMQENIFSKQIRDELVDSIKTLTFALEKIKKFRSK
jgi:hypothetical protein